MFLIYVDESGDNGYPLSSSNTFVNTAIQIPADKWNSFTTNVENFRINLEATMGFPRNMEIHTANIIRRKDVYAALKQSDEDIKNMFLELSRFISKQDILMTSVVIDKSRLVGKCNVFDVCVNFLLNRINKTINVRHKDLPKKERSFLIFCDRGRINNWEKLVRKLKGENYLPLPRYKTKINIPLNQIIENPIERDSEQSDLLQIADFVVTIIKYYYEYNYMGRVEMGRTKYISKSFIAQVLDIIKPRINIDAHRFDQYGVARFPK